MQKIIIGKKVVAALHCGVLIINDSVESKLTGSEKQQFYVELNGLSPTKIEVRPDFRNFQDLQAINKRMILGEDVSLELAYNDVELPKGFEAAVLAFKEAVAPVTLALLGKVPEYPFAAIASPVEWRIEGKHVMRGAYGLKLVSAKAIWLSVSPKWYKSHANGSRFSSNTASLYLNQQDIVGYSAPKYCYQYKNWVEIGCQRIQRYELEQLALDRGWPFPTA